MECWANASRVWVNGNMSEGRERGWEYVAAQDTHNTAHRKKHEKCPCSIIIYIINWYAFQRTRYCFLQVRKVCNRQPWEERENRSQTVNSQKIICQPKTIASSVQDKVFNISTSVRRPFRTKEVTKAPFNLIHRQENKITVTVRKNETFVTNIKSTVKHHNWSVSEKPFACTF